MPAVHVVLVVGMLMLATVAPQLAAQSCAAADSLLGRQAKTGDLKVKYDRMTDTTRVATKTDERMLSEFTILSLFPGDQIERDAALVFEFRERQGAPTTRTTLTAANGKHSPKSTLQFLADDSVRFTLGSPEYAVELSPAFGPFPASLEETLRFPLTLEYLGNIAGAREVRVRIASFEIKLARKVIDGAGELYRRLVCGQTVTLIE